MPATCDSNPGHPFPAARPHARGYRMTKKLPERNSQTSVKSNGRQEYVVGYCKPPIELQFKPGQGGRRRGSRNRLGEDFLRALAEDFENHGAEVIERVRIEKPEAYLKVIASLLPKDLNLNVSKYDDLTDEQLLRLGSVCPSPLDSSATGVSSTSLE